MDLMTFKEIRERMANRDLIREKQEMEERAEAEREREADRERRKAERLEQAANAAAVAATASAMVKAAGAENTSAASATTTTAAADTSSEVAKKIKDKFLKDMSKVMVKVLDPYRRPDVPRGHIKSKEDFKHLAQKVSDQSYDSEQFLSLHLHFFAAHSIHPAKGAKALHAHRRSPLL